MPSVRPILENCFFFPHLHFSHKHSLNLQPSNPIYTPTLFLSLSLSITSHPENQPTKPSSPYTNPSRISRAKHQIHIASTNVPISPPHPPKSHSALLVTITEKSWTGGLTVLMALIALIFNVWAYFADNGEEEKKRRKTANTLDRERTILTMKKDAEERIRR